jgi:phospholipid/cholesterol/gamma-HCH transport system substrate-binding protein
MRLNRRVKLQLAIFMAVALVAGAVMIFGFIRLPAVLFGVGEYTVTVELPRAGGIYGGANVTYRGTEVGRVTAVHLTDKGVAAVLALRSDVAIPSDLDADVHSVSAVGEQFVALSPRNGTSPPLKNGDTVAVDRSAVPPDINGLVDATNRGLQAIPRDNLKTVVDESYTAVGGLGPEISRIVRGSTALAIDANAQLDSLTSLIDNAQPVLDSQANTADAIQAWSAHLAEITAQLRNDDVAGVLTRGPSAADEARQLFDRVQPTVPILLANLVSLGQVAVTYQAGIEQLLVAVPVTVQNFYAVTVPNHNTKQAYRGATLDFNLNINLPQPCTTGYLPAQQRRSSALEDYPDVPEGALYCRVPQDSMIAVRGARNIPCETKPWKRAPTAWMCESDEQYVPLNDGNNWKGDPNATLTGQDVPQLPPGTPRAPDAPAPTNAPPLSLVEYDPATGNFTGPDGKSYPAISVSQPAKPTNNWETMLLPPQGR